MNLIERLVPHLIFLAALLPTVLLLLAAALSFASPGPLVEYPLTVQTAAACEPCQGGAAYR
jgi:hypothetical protein